MVPRDILSVLTASKQESVFAAAEILAKRWKAHITALYLARQPEPLDADVYYATALWADLLEQARQSFAREREAIQKRVDRIEAQVEVRQEEVLAGTAEATVARHALHADLTIMALPDTEPGQMAFEGALFRSGRPVMLIPPQWKGETIGRRILVAWKARPEAARALAEAAPFLAAAEEVTVVTVDAQPDGYGGGPGRDISTHLARKGLDIELRNVDGMGRPPELALLNEARSVAADLIVMGGYGHSRLREYVLGGVTRALTRASPVPILLSH